MKALFTILISIISFTSYTQNFTLDIKKSDLKWIGYGEVGNFKQEGTIKAKSGAMNLDQGIIQSADISIDMKSIQHDDKSLSKHLSNKDFFWSKKYPIATLKMISLENDNLTAELTIRGKTQSIQFPFELIEEEDIILVRGKLTIDRTEYDIKYNSSSYFQDLGSYAIKNEFDLLFDLHFVPFSN